MNDTLPADASPTAASDCRGLPALAVIAAVARNGIIGSDNRLPWRLPEDLRRFRALTTGHAIIMGRRTWESIGRPLPERQNIVVTRRREYLAAGAEVAGSLAAARGLVRLPAPAFVVGGEALYREALPLATCLYLTEIERDFDGDARFPEYARTQWRQTSREPGRAAGDDGLAYAFVAYERA